MSGGPLAVGECACARRGAYIEARNRDQTFCRLGRRCRAAEQRLIHPEVACELVPVLFCQPARDSALDELLDVSGITPEHAGQASIVLAPLLDQPGKLGPCILGFHQFPMHENFCLDK